MRKGKNLNIWLPDHLWDFMQSETREWETTTGFICQMLQDRLQAKLDKIEAEKPKPRKSKKVTWEDTRDRVSAYLTGIGEHEYLANMPKRECDGDADAFWKKYHKEDRIKMILGDIESFEANKKPAV